MSELGPQSGMRSVVTAQRQRAKLLELEGYAGVSATPETVARLAAAKVKLDLGGTDSVTLNLGDGVKTYQLGDIELLLGLCCEGFERYDAAG